MRGRGKTDCLHKVCLYVSPSLAVTFSVKFSPHYAISTPRAAPRACYLRVMEYIQKSTGLPAHVSFSAA